MYDKYINPLKHVYHYYVSRDGGLYTRRHKLVCQASVRTLIVVHCEMIARIIREEVIIAHHHATVLYLYQSLLVMHDVSYMKRYVC